MTKAQQFVGVDGCKGGWLAAVWRPESRSLQWVGYPDLVTLLTAFPDSVVGVDIPLGLWEQGDRPCDKAARKLLGKPRSSSVFAPPIPSILNSPTFSSANEASLAAISTGVSQQSFALFAKLRESNSVVTPEIQHRVFEVHPEVSFFGLAERAMSNRKIRTAGYEERREILNAALDLWDIIPLRKELSARVRVFGAKPDDALDAAIAAWTAHRVASGTAIRLRGDAIYRGANDLIMEIVY